MRLPSPLAAPTGMASGEDKALRPAGDVVVVSGASMPVALRPAPAFASVDDDTSASGGDGEAVVEVETVAEDDGDDEQVERFYALLASIRALRGMHYRSTAAGAGASASACTGSGRGGQGSKRARGASEPPWRPAFRIEDFQEVVAAGEEGRAGKRAMRGGVIGRPPSRTETDAGEEEAEDEAVEARGAREPGRRVAARG
ncbi:hypothetical protein ACP4OV_009001 [Aristida adscensionis]